MIKNELESYFEENKDKPINEWLQFKKNKIPNGRQGMTGILHNKNKIYFYKTSLYIDYSIRKEYIVMSGLNELGKYCPHFCKCIGILNCLVEPNKTKDGNIFNIVSKYPIKKDVLLCEYLSSNETLTELIEKGTSEKVLYSIIKQVLLSILIAQKEKRFTHYDLHSSNIMIKKCNPNVVFLYVLDEEKKYAIPTYGYYPVIIDFGYSYSQDLDDSYLWGTLSQTDIGFTTDRFDNLIDFKLFLVSVSYEMKDNFKSENSKIFRKIVKQIFNGLKLDWETGWDKYKYKNTTKFLRNILCDYNNSSSLFKEYPDYCIDVIQTLIVTPMELQDYEDIETNFLNFLEEWKKIEEQITNMYYLLYILKNIIDIARCIRSDFYLETKKQNAINTFKIEFLNVLTEVSSFCTPKEINYEKMLSNLYLFSINMEGVFFTYIKNTLNIKNKYLKKIPSTNINEIFDIIDCNIETRYRYNKKTNIIVVNCIKKQKDILKIDKKQSQFINSLEPIYHGSLLYDSINL